MYLPPTPRNSPQAIAARSSHLHRPPKSIMQAIASSSSSQQMQRNSLSRCVGGQHATSIAPRLAPPGSPTRPRAAPHECFVWLDDAAPRESLLLLLQGGTSASGSATLPPAGCAAAGSNQAAAGKLTWLTALSGCALAQSPRAAASSPSRARALQMARPTPCTVHRGWMVIQRPRCPPFCCLTGPPAPVLMVIQFRPLFCAGRHTASC